MNWKKLRIRLLSAGILVMLLFIATFSPEWVFSLAVCGVGVVVLYEMMATFKQETKPAVVRVNYIFAALYMVTAFLQQDTSNRLVYMISVLFVITLLTVSVIWHKEVAFEDVCSSLFLVIYTVVFLIHLAFLRNMEHGIAQLFFAFVGAFITDTAAYFFGSFFGKHKLIEEISPNKTIEGAIGGVVGSIIGFFVYGGILTALGFTVDFLRIGILALLCGFVAQLGDLSASMMKRAYKVKDFGNLIPGHGGLVDRIDSLLFVTPVVYYFISHFPII